MKNLSLFLALALFGCGPDDPEEPAPDYNTFVAQAVPEHVHADCPDAGDYQNRYHPELRYPKDGGAKN